MNNDNTPAYEADDEPLTAEQIRLIQKYAGVPQDIDWSESLFAMTEAEYAKLHGFDQQG